MGTGTEFRKNVANRNPIILHSQGANPAQNEKSSESTNTDNRYGTGTAAVPVPILNIFEN
jgi:hypothetical protein